MGPARFRCATLLESISPKIETNSKMCSSLDQFRSWFSVKISTHTQTTAEVTLSPIHQFTILLLQRPGIEPGPPTCSSLDQFRSWFSVKISTPTHTTAEVTLSPIHQFTILLLHRPGIEPGPPTWQASILPLNHRCHIVQFNFAQRNLQKIHGR